jgi:ATP-dependent DNA helicase RecG
LRPALLDRLFAPAVSLPGIGPQLGRLIERVAGPLVVDLLWHLPTGLIDRRASPSVTALQHDSVVTLKLKIERHEPGMGRRPYRVIGYDGTGFITLIYFNVKSDYLQRLLPVGAERIVSGKVEFYGNIPQIAHPDHVVALDQADRIKPIEPTYPLTAGLPPRVLQRTVATAVERAPSLAEWIDGPLLQQRQWPGWHEALAAVHTPQSEADLSPSTPARERLAYDEIFASQLAVALVRARRQRRRGRVLQGSGAMSATVEAGFGFALTQSQRLAIAEIAADMKAPQQMMRLLQGDVGSGKTVVALLAMLIAVESGAQAALMAPTEVLARQHHATLQRLAAPAGIEVALLTGRERGKPRDSLLASLASGLTPIVVGTHALLTTDVEFRDLALAVIDEQHRFGVEHRLSLIEKGRTSLRGTGLGSDYLVMSATPFPRTVMMAAFGDLDASRLTEKPPGRHPVDTRAVPIERADDVLAGIVRAIAQGGKAYWICPMVEESESTDIAAVEERHRTLSAMLPGKVGLVHGRMKGPNKDRAMSEFAGDKIDILVGTTVLEVGIDVPQATVMVIEHAERFGLAQLHQLRGRIGRGEKQSTCLLLYQSPLSEMAERRLRILRETSDGFRIAEEDLRLRGAGEVLGTQQSGFPTFRLANFETFDKLLPIAHNDARLVLDRDPTLSSARGAALRILLYLFRRDEAVQYLGVG